ncbi:MAG TPA: LysR family transcriptional regulator [Bellilinea sp.]|nr:LysR family transcriptional regulator [Bellilinea sp.]
MLRITFRQLEAFYWAATLGTVNAAAKHLYVSQPAITARIRELEEVLGLALLSRSQQGVQLTPAGSDVLAHAQRVLRMGEELESSGRQEVPPLDGVLRLGADDAAAALAVAEMLRQLKVRFPALRVDVSIDVSKALHEKMIRRELDVALQTTPVARPHVVDLFLGRVQLAWVAGASMELNHTPFSPRDAPSVPIVTNPPPSILNPIARDWLAKAPNDLSRLNTCNSLSMIMKIVQDGHAIAVLPVPVVMDYLKSGAMKLVAADPPFPPMAYYVSYLSEKEASGALTIVELAKEILTNRQFFDDGYI